MVELLSLITSRHDTKYQRNPAWFERWRRVNYQGRDCVEGMLFGMPGVDDGTWVRTPTIIHLEADCDTPYVVTVLTWFKLGSTTTKGAEMTAT